MPHGAAVPPSSWLIVNDRDSDVPAWRSPTFSQISTVVPSPGSSDVEGAGPGDEASSSTPTGSTARKLALNVSVPLGLLAVSVTGVTSPNSVSAAMSALRSSAGPSPAALSAAC